MGIFNFFRNKKKEIDNEDYFDRNNSIEEVEETIDEEVEEKEIKVNENLNKEVRFDYKFYNEAKNEDIKKVKNEIYEEIISNNIETSIKNQIIKVMESEKNFSSINNQAELASKIIKSENSTKVKKYLIEKIDLPNYVKENYKDEEELNIAYENAILTIIYNFKEEGVDELLKISMEIENCKFKAINLLCKLADSDIENEKIVDSIIYIMKNSTEEDTEKMLLFLSQIKNNPKIEKLLNLYYKKYLQENNIEQAYDTVINIIDLKGTCSTRKMIFLKAIALHETVLNLNIILENTTGEIDFKNISEDLKVKAAITFYSLNKSDEEINQRLLYLKENSLDEEVRKFLNEYLN